MSEFLGAHKSVVTAGEVEQIVKEMGPIDAAAGEATGAAPMRAANRRRDAEPPPKRLFRIPEGAHDRRRLQRSGRLFGVDVAFMRIVFVLAALITKGAGIFAYMVLMFVIPEANTPEQRAAAGGAPFNAQEVVDRAKKQYAEGTRHGGVSGGSSSASGDGTAGHRECRWPYGPPPWLRRCFRCSRSCISPCSWRWRR